MNQKLDQILDNQRLLEQQIKALETSLHTIQEASFAIYDSMLDQHKQSRHFVANFKEKFSSSNYIAHFQELDNSIKQIKEIHTHIQEKISPEINEIVVKREKGVESSVKGVEKVIQGVEKQNQEGDQEKRTEKQFILPVPADLQETAGTESLAPAVALDSDGEESLEEDEFCEVEAAAEKLLGRVQEGVKEVENDKRIDFQNRVIKFVGQISEQVSKSDAEFDRKRGVWQVLERITEIVK